MTHILYFFWDGFRENETLPVVVTARSELIYTCTASATI